MTEKLGIENLKKEIDLVLAIMGVILAAKKDGIINAGDLGLLLNLIPVLGPAAEGIGSVIPELKDLTEAEGQELANHVLGKLTGIGPKAMTIVEKSLKFAVAAYELEKAITAPAEAPVA